MSKSIIDRLSFRCEIRWRDLTPRGEGRHCFQCDTTVIDISRLSRQEALRRTEGGACVRLRFDAVGDPIFRIEPSRTAIGGLVVATALLGGCAAEEEPIAPVELSVDPIDSATGEGATPEPELPAGIRLGSLAHIDEYDAALADMRYEGGPTPEQIALTRAKRRAQQPVAAPVHQVEYLGMIDPGW